MCRETSWYVFGFRRAPRNSPGSKLDVDYILRSPSIPFNLFKGGHWHDASPVIIFNSAVMKYSRVLVQQTGIPFINFLPKSSITPSRRYI